MSLKKEISWLDRIAINFSAFGDEKAQNEFYQREAPQYYIPSGTSITSSDVGGLVAYSSNDPQPVRAVLTSTPSGVSWLSNTVVESDGIAYQNVNADYTVGALNIHRDEYGNDFILQADGIWTRRL